MSEKLVFVYFIFVLIKNCFQICYGNTSNYITVFDVGHQGERLDVSILQCTTLSENWRHRVSAIATHGLCVRLFDRSNCTGNSIEVLPSSPAHHDLNAWNFNNKAVSVGPCRHECSTEITGNLANTPFQISIYNQYNYQGLNRSIDVQGCVVTPLRFLQKTRSIHSFGNCVQLYSNPTCDPHLGRNIELRRGTPYHNDLAEWEMTQAKSVSHCAHKCTNDSSGGLEDGDVVLFDEHNLKGNFLKLNVREGNCLNINADWEAAAMSVQVQNGTCVTLFDRHNCLGEFLNVNKSNWNLRSVQFHTKARSMKSCGSYEVSTTIRTISETKLVAEFSSIDKLDEDEFKQSGGSSDGVGMTPLIIFVIVLLVLVTLMIIVVKVSPGVRNNINRYYGALRNRLFEEDASEDFFSGFRWETDDLPNEPSRNFVLSQATVPQDHHKESNVDFDFFRESTGRGAEAVYEEVVYKNTVSII